MAYLTWKSENCASRSGEIADILLSHRIGVFRHIAAVVFAGAAIFCGLIGFSIKTMEKPCPLDTINPNTDPAASLVRLPRIGPALAAAIVDYRREHGAFVRVEDLDAVPRIGPATVDKMRDWITLDNVQSAAE